MSYRSYGFRWAPYVSVSQKLAMAKKRAAQVAEKQKRQPSPVEIVGRKIATSFWGKAWCDNLEAYSDFSNRLPRGATYVRNGSVVDLVIAKGAIEAIVAGSEPYTVKITISELAKATWRKIKQDCSASIDSLIDLLSGRLSDGVMRRLTEKKGGCFPSPSEIKMKCSCPDYSYCCKHIAAVMYGVGSRLDTQPELLFLLRGVDHLELINQAVSKKNLDRELSTSSAIELAGQDLGEMFGIELDTSTPPSTDPKSSPKRRRAVTVARSQLTDAKKVLSKNIQRVDQAVKASVASPKRLSRNKALAKSPSTNPPASISPASISPANISPANKSPANKSPASKPTATDSPTPSSLTIKSPAMKSPARKPSATKAITKKRPIKVKTVAKPARKSTLKVTSPK